MGVRSSTHVANAYNTDVLAMVRGDTEKTEFEKLGIAGSEAARKYIYDYCEKNGYTKIRSKARTRLFEVEPGECPRYCLRYHINCRWGYYM